MIFPTLTKGLLLPHLTTRETQDVLSKPWHFLSKRYRQKNKLVTSKHNISETGLAIPVISDCKRL